MVSFEEFANWLEKVQKLKNEGTIHQYVSHVRLALQEGPEERLTSDDLAPLTKRLTLAALRQWAAYANDDALAKMLSRFHKVLPPPDRAKERRPLTHPEWERLLNEIEEMENGGAKSAIGLMAVRGFRIGAVLKLTRASIIEASKSGTLSFFDKRSKQHHWTVTKRMKPFIEPLVDISNWHTVSNLICPISKPEALHKSAITSIQRTLKDLAEDAGIPPEDMYPHRLRRTVATFFLENADIVKLKNWMGWSNINTASMYVDFAEKKVLDEIAERMF